MSKEDIETNEPKLNKSKKEKLKDISKWTLDYIRSYKLVVISILLLWFKTYIVAKYVFDMDIENKYQEIILFISPLSFSILIYGISLFLVSSKFRNKMLVIVSVLTSFIIYGNVMFYRFYNDFVTVPVLFQTDNMGDLGSSVSGLLKFSDVFYIIDVLVLLILINVLKMTSKNFKRPSSLILMGFGVFIFFINLSMSETERPELLTRTFDREILVKNLGIFNYHIYDVFIQSKTSAQKALAEENDIDEVEEYIKGEKIAVNEDLKGIAEGKNVVFIALESLQTFLINEDLDGEEITPFLNSLVKDSYYFNNIYHQTAQGKSSDSEFVIDTSWYPLGRGSVYFTHAQNTYKGLPLILGDNGYSTNTFHANNKSFWNRDMMYVSMGYEHYYDIQSYEVNDENSVGWGLKDKEFFSQSIDLMKGLEEPYFGKLITLTNHFPFELEEDDMVIKPWTSNSKTLNKYFTTVNYLDRAVESYFTELKENDLYEDTVFVLYGDHYGISETHNKAMAKYLNKGKLTSYDVAELQKVPLYIHIPGVTDEGRGGEINVYGGQIDIKPTLLNLLGIEDEDLQFGSDLFSKDNTNEVVFRDGRVVNDTLVYAGDVCYVRPEKASSYMTDEEILDAENRLESKKLNYEKAYEDYLLDLEKAEEENTLAVLDSELDENAEVTEEVVEVAEVVEDIETTDETITEERIVYSFEEFKEAHKEKLKTGYSIDKSNCKDLIEFAKNELKYSDKLIYGDLMRFYSYLEDIKAEEFESEKLIEDLMKKESLKSAK